MHAYFFQSSSDHLRNIVDLGLIFDYLYIYRFDSNFLETCFDLKKLIEPLRGTASLLIIKTLFDDK
jgi:hypothetical protein